MENQIFKNPENELAKCSNAAVQSSSILNNAQVSEAILDVGKAAQREAVSTRARWSNVNIHPSYRRCQYKPTSEATQSSFLPCFCLKRTLIITVIMNS